MGIFKRFGTVVKANINSWLDSAEDPQKLKEQAILDLEESKKKAKAFLIKSMGALKLAENKLASHQQAISELVREAEIFLQEHKDAEASKNIAKKQQLEQEIEALGQESLTHKQTIDMIKKGISALEQKLQALKSTLIVDQESATDAFDTFSRMEDKIDSREAELAALQELLSEVEHKKSAEESADSKITHKAPSLDDELKALKDKLKKPRS